MDEQIVYMSPQRFAFICNILDRNQNENQNQNDYQILLTPHIVSKNTVLIHENMKQQYIFNAIVPKEDDGFLYVFDILSESVKQQLQNELQTKFAASSQIDFITQFTRFKWIRKFYEYIHSDSENTRKQVELAQNVNDKFIVQTVDDVERIIQNDNDLMKKINEDYDTKWFPKPVMLVNTSSQEFVKIVEKYPSTIYKNEGWIIMIYFRSNLMFKALLKLNVQNVHEYVNNSELYYPLEHIDLKIDVSLRKYLELRTMYINNLLHKILRITDIVLDIGCGNGSFFKKRLTYNKYIGIDKDYCCLVRAEKYVKYNDTLIWGDILNKNWGYFDNMIYDNTYNVVVMINTIHLFVNNIDILMNNLDKITKKGTKIFIATIDPTKLCDINYKNQLVVKKLENNNYRFRYKWINKEFDEELIMCDLLKKIFEDRGWKEISTNSSFLINNEKLEHFYKSVYCENEIKLFDKSHVCLLFEKI